MVIDWFGAYYTIMCISFVAMVIRMSMVFYIVMANQGEEHQGDRMDLHTFIKLRKAMILRNSASKIWLSTLCILIPGYSLYKTTIGAYALMCYKGLYAIMKMHEAMDKSSLIRLTVYQDEVGNK